jgi:hypothetical protein
MPRAKGERSARSQEQRGLSRSGWKITGSGAGVSDCAHIDLRNCINEYFILSEKSECLGSRIRAHPGCQAPVNDYATATKKFVDAHPEKLKAWLQQ